MVGSFIVASLKDDLFRRLFKNAGILLTGNVSASLIGFISLVLTARALGAENFGILVLITTYVVVVDKLINFQSWQALIKYGAETLEQSREKDFKSLLKFGFMLDMGTALAGTLIAASLAWYVGHWQGWSPDIVLMVTLYSVTILFHIAGAPTAILRLFDRFKLFSLISFMMAAIKLMGVTIAYLAGAELWAFIIIWAVTDILGKAILVFFSLRELRHRRIHKVRLAPLHQLAARFPGIWGFVITTNLNSSIRMTTREADALIIGALLTPTAVGLYKIAKQIANVLGILNDPLYQSIYPEFARLRATKDNTNLIKLAIRSASIAGTVALLMWVLLIFMAEPLLYHAFGQEYVAAKQVMLWYVLAIVIAIFAFPLQPIMLALGQPQKTLLIHIVGTSVYFAALFPLISLFELAGAGIAYIFYYLSWSILMLISIILFMKRE